MAGNKRKDVPSGAPGQQNGGKKKKTGNSGKWKTPHQNAKQLDYLQPGDKGVWVTCARHQEAKAAREVSMLFTEYLEKMYGIKDKEEVESEDGDIDDIEAAVQKDVASLKAKGKSAGGEEGDYFASVKMNVDCLLFFRTKAPIEPVEFVRRICADAKASEPGQLKCRYVNRLTPITVIGKATESGILDVARAALSTFFKLAASTEAPLTRDEDGGVPGVEPGKGEVQGAENQTREYKPSTFAVRPTIRNHTNLKRDFVIQQTAGLVDQGLHKVNLSSPDQVILIDIYQTVCGMSVVGSDWEDLKRYNLSELYGVSAKTTMDKDS